MSKIRPPLTAEYAVRQALGLVPITQIAEVIERTTDLVYKFSDPDDHREVSVNAALKIDRLCYRQKGIAPFADLFRLQIEDPEAVAANIKELTLKSQAALGTLSATVLNAVSDSGAGGTKITPRERQELMIEIDELKTVIARIESAVIAASTEGGRR